MRETVSQTQILLGGQYRVVHSLINFAELLDDTRSAAQEQHSVPSENSISNFQVVNTSFENSNFTFKIQTLIWSKFKVTQALEDVPK